MSSKFEKNKSLDKFLVELNQALLPSEQALEEQYADKGKGFPTILKVGLPRVGGTLLTQWAASSGLFYLPTNFLSRFYGTPCTGALITELLQNPAYDYRDEFSDVNRTTGYGSDIGKTSGLLAPHEFWYFWRHRLHLPDIPSSNSEFLEKSDLRAFERSLNAFKGIVGKPIFLKGHLVNFYLESFTLSEGNYLYFHLKRNLLDVAQSLYFSRIKWKGDDKCWFSHKPREFDELQELDPFHQIAGQVYFIEKAVLNTINLLGERYFSIDYKELCEKPGETHHEFMKLVAKYSENVVNMIPYQGPSSFKYSSNPDPLVHPKLETALRYFQDKYGELH